MPHTLLRGFLGAFLTSLLKRPHSQMGNLRLELLAQITEARTCFRLDLSRSAFLL